MAPFIGGVPRGGVLRLYDEEDRSDGWPFGVSLCVDDADMPYALSIDDVTLKRVERRVIDGDPLCADIYDLATAGDASRIAVRIAAAGRVSTPRISVLRVVAC